MQHTAATWASRKLVLGNTSAATSPFAGLHIADTEPLNRQPGREPCPRCSKSRKFFCYTCYVPIASLGTVLTISLGEKLGPWIRIQFLQIRIQPFFLEWGSISSCFREAGPDPALKTSFKLPCEEFRFAKVEELTKKGCSKVKKKKYMEVDSDPRG